MSVLWWRRYWERAASWHAGWNPGARLGGAYGSHRRSPQRLLTRRPSRRAGQVNVDAAEEKVSEAAAGGTARAEQSVCASECWKLGTRGG